MQQQDSRENLGQTLLDLENRMREIQNIRKDRELRLAYFIDEGVSSMIVQKALTSVEEATVAIMNLGIQISKVREKIRNLDFPLT